MLEPVGPLSGNKSPMGSKRSPAPCAKRCGCTTWEMRSGSAWCLGARIRSCFQFHVGHNVPESKGGGLNIGNLRPICDRCNASMGNSYTIDEWSRAFEDKSANSQKNCCCAVM